MIDATKPTRAESDDARRRPRETDAHGHETDGREKTPLRSDLPLQRELIDWSIPQTAGLWQFGDPNPSPEIEVLPLQLALDAGDDGNPEGRRARAEGVLAELEFSVLGRLCQEFQRTGCPENNAVYFNPGALSQAIAGHRSGTKRQLLKAAVRNLLATAVVIPGFNPATQRIEPGIEFEGNLLAGLVSQSVYREWEQTMTRSRAAEARGDTDEATRQLANARKLEGKMRGDDTWIAFLPQWMGDRIRRYGGIALDAEAHRALRRNHLNVAIALEGLPYISDGDAGRETAVVDLTRAVYEALGLRYEAIGESKRVLHRALERILAVNPTYETLTIRPHQTRKRVNQLVVVRYTGVARQQRLRERALEKVRAGA
jgi:hypothetical protein